MDSKITTDFHSHILPGADHGSDSVEMSVKQLGLISSYGIKRVVATPHFYPTSDNLALFLERRAECAAALAERLRPEDPTVFLGAEVQICAGLDRMEGLEQLAVAGTNCILLEMPMIKWTDAIYETVDAISRSGLVAVMAHIDRYNPKYIDELMRLHVKAQLNPGTFSSKKGRKFAEKWLSYGKVVAVGSDLHHANEKEYKEFHEATEALGEYTERVEGSMINLLDGAKPLTKDTVL